MHQKALLIGNSDGIGLTMTKRLLESGWTVTGISRSDSPINDPAYRHVISDVAAGNYPEIIEAALLDGAPDLCIYFAGIGELLDLHDMQKEAIIFNVNLMGMVKTAAGIIPAMVERRSGHFIGISSMADELLSAEAPSYHASKAGFSNYLEGLSLSLRPQGVFVTNVRFGFVDTKMAKGDTKPFMMTVGKAADHIERCMLKKPAHYSAPKIAIPLIKLRKTMMRFA